MRVGQWAQAKSSSQILSWIEEVNADIMYTGVNQGSATGYSRGNLIKNILL